MSPTIDGGEMCFPFTCLVMQIVLFESDLNDAGVVQLSAKVTRTHFPNEDPLNFLSESTKACLTPLRLFSPCFTCTQAASDAFRMVPPAAILPARRRRAGAAAWGGGTLRF